MTDREFNLPTGPAAAAFIAVGIGCLAMGVVTVLCEASPPLKQALNLYPPAGPLTGKVLSAVVAWAGLHVAWRNRNVALGSAVAVTLVLVALAFVATFPPVFQLAEGQPAAPLSLLTGDLSKLSVNIHGTVTIKPRRHLASLPRVPVPITGLLFRI